MRDENIEIKPITHGSACFAIALSVIDKSVIVNNVLMLYLFSYKKHIKIMDTTVEKTTKI